MKANETVLRALLDGQKQYVVPLFQRRYSWGTRQWRSLWDDIADISQAPPTAEHFLGALVTIAQPGTPEGISAFLLIDGQQRLTTLAVLLAALRDECGDPAGELAQKIERLYLRNQFAHGQERFKILPTQVDRDAFASIMNRQGAPSGSRVSDAYSFFVQRVRDATHNGGSLSPTTLFNLIMTQLGLVSISLSQDDNPYRIFESLNAKGMPLAQSDLIRNYFFMRLPVSNHERLYTGVWLKMEALLPGFLESFFRDYLVKDGQFVRSDEVYQTWKGRLEPLEAPGIERVLLQLRESADFYARLVQPSYEPSFSIRRQLIRLNRWGGTTAYPFLTNLYSDLAAGRLTEAGMRQTLVFIESYLVRRLFCKIPTNDLNRVFIRLYSQLPEGHSIERAIKLALSDPGRRWPADTEFRQGLETYSLYRDSRPDQRRLVLESLEEGLEGKEHVVLDNLQIEHIMPQTVTEEWTAMLGDGAQETHERLLHTLGNLTLSAYNPELSNSSFVTKKQILGESNLAMNRQVAQASVWDAAAITARAKALAEEAIKIWPGPER